MGEGLQAIAMIGISVEPKLHKAQGCRTLGENLATPGGGLLIELLTRHHLVDQPHSGGVLGAVLVTQIPDLTRLFLTHDTRQVHGAKAGVKTPHLGTGLAKNGALRGDGQVTEDMQDMATTNGIAIDLGDDRLGNLADHTMQVAHLETRCPLFVMVPALATDFLIPAGTEIALLAREHHDADTVVVPGIVEGL